MLLTSDPLPEGVGGGGTTLRPGSGTLPVASLRISVETSAEGGGATTDGAGMLSLAVRELARSGAETGGGTTASFVICSGECDTSRLATFGAGGITLADNAIPERVLLAVTFGAGATTEGFNAGSFNPRSFATRGAGGMTSDPSAGATNL